MKVSVSDGSENVCIRARDMGGGGGRGRNYVYRAYAFLSHYYASCMFMRHDASVSLRRFERSVGSFVTVGGLIHCPSVIRSCTWSVDTRSEQILWRLTTVQVLYAGCCYRSLSSRLIFRARVTANGRSISTTGRVFDHDLHSKTPFILYLLSYVMTIFALWWKAAVVFKIIRELTISPLDFMHSL